jgi:hypothetical protein
LCPLAQPLKKAATPAIKNAITPNKAEKLLAFIDSPKPAIERKTRIHEIAAAISNQPPARTQDEAPPPPAVENAERARFMQDIFQPA